MKKESLFTKGTDVSTDINFFYRQKCLDKMSGWLSPASHGIISFLFDYQSKINIVGNIGEIGVWEGKTASIICNYCRDEESVFLIDPIISNNQETILRNIDDLCRKLPKSLYLCNILSEKFLTIYNDSNLFNSFRFFHIDGCHTGSSVFSDMKLVDKLLSNNSVLVIDDFFNPGYPQITEAVYRYVFEYPYSFRIFFVGFNKAYLCRPGCYTMYYSHCINNLQQSMLNKKMAITIKKTSSIGDCYTLSAEEYKQEIDLNTGIQGPDWEPERMDYIETK